MGKESALIRGPIASLAALLKLKPIDKGNPLRSFIY